MKLYLIALAAFVAGTVFGMWLLAKVVTAVLNKLDQEERRYD